MAFIIHFTKVAIAVLKAIFYGMGFIAAMAIILVIVLATYKKDKL